MQYKDQAIGILIALFIILGSSVLIYGLGSEPNVGVFLGPLMIAAVYYYRYKKTVVVLENDEGAQLMLTGASKETMDRFVEMGYRRIS